MQILKAHRRIVCMLLSAVMVFLLGACGNAESSNSGKQDEKGTIDYLKEYIAENGFSMVENGEERTYYDYEATEKLYEMVSEMKDQETASDLLARFKTVDNQLLKIKKTTSQGTEVIFCHYDENGKIIKKYVEGEQDYYYTYKYNEQGQMTEKNQVRQEDHCIEKSFTYQYDEHGNCVKYIDENGRNYSYKYVYDAEGQITEGIKADMELDGEITVDATSYTYQYDDQNRVTRLSGKSSYNDKDIIYDFVYNEEGKLVKETRTGNEAVMIVEYIYKDNQLIQKIKTVTGQVKTVEQYSYTYGTRYYFDGEGLSI